VAKLIKTKCPNCGAPIRIDLGGETATCEFCHHTSLLARKGRAPQRTQATMHLKTIDVDAARQRARTMILVIVLLLTFLPIGIVGAVIYTVFRGVTTVTNTAFKQVNSSLDKAFGGSPGASGKTGAKLPPKAKSALGRALSQLNKRVPIRGLKVEADDLSKVDGLELLLQARLAALKVDRHAKLRQAYFRRVAGGVIDVARGDGASFDFHYNYKDAKRPPGEDTVKGRLSVSLNRGKFRVLRHGGSSRGRALREPSCGTAKLWKALVASGVPNNAVGRLYYQRAGRARGRGDRTVWRFYVSGHREYSRTADGQTCKVLRKR
jgi:uncharacterized membrane protein